MLLYLVRHGESDTSGLDNERALSENGKNDLQRLAHFITPLQLSITKLYYSEKLRAKQTAEILYPAMTLKEAAQSRRELEPLAPIQPIINELERYQVNTLLVGHMPFLGKLLNTLISGVETTDVIAFKAGSMVCLEQLAAKQWLLRWLIIPELLTSSVT